MQSGARLYMKKIGDERATVLYNVDSCVNGTTRTVFQSYKSKAYAVKAAYKRFDSGCYNCVIVWKENTEQIGNSEIILVLRKE